MSEPLTTKEKIAQLHKELGEMTPAENLVVAQDIIDDLYAVNTGLRADNARLREALKKYGGHRRLCTKGKGPTLADARNCTCGFDDALKEHDDE